MSNQQLEHLRFKLEVDKFPSRKLIEAAEGPYNRLAQIDR